MGANVVLAARRAEALEDVARTIRANGGEALVVPTDVSRPEAVEALAEAAERRFGWVDVNAPTGEFPVGRRPRRPCSARGSPPA